MSANILALPFDRIAPAPVARFCDESVDYFNRQDYSKRELVIVDDGEDRIEDLVPAGDPWIRYLRLDERASIARNRQLCCAAADGEVLVQWDDDDWSGPARLSRQIGVLAGAADITGIRQGYLLDVPTSRFYKGGPPMHVGHLHPLIVTGTLTFTRRAWDNIGGYPDSTPSGEVPLLRAILEHGGRVATTDNDGLFILVRHHANTWRPVHYDMQRGPAGWTPVAPPEFLPAEDLAFYRSLR